MERPLSLVAIFTRFKSTHHSHDNLTYRPISNPMEYRWYCKEQEQITLPQRVDLNNRIIKLRTSPGLYTIQRYNITKNRNTMWSDAQWHTSSITTKSRPLRFRGSWSTLDLEDSNLIVSLSFASQNLQHPMLLTIIVHAGFCVAVHTSRIVQGTMDFEYM